MSIKENIVSTSTARTPNFGVAIIQRPRLNGRLFSGWGPRI